MSHAALPEEVRQRDKLKFEREVTWKIDPM